MNRLRLGRRRFDPTEVPDDVMRRTRASHLPHPVRLTTAIPWQRRDKRLHVVIAEGAHIRQTDAREVSRKLRGSKHESVHRLRRVTDPGDSIYESVYEGPQGTAPHSLSQPRGPNHCLERHRASFRRDPAAEVTLSDDVMWSAEDEVGWSTTTMSDRSRSSRPAASHNAALHRIEIVDGLDKRKMPARREPGEPCLRSFF
jgi:hypothetical protein